MLAKQNRIKWATGVGLVAGPALPLLATALSPLMAGGMIAGSVVAVACVSWPFLSVLLTAAVVPLERIGRFTNDHAAFTFSLMRIFGLLGLLSLLLHCMLSKRKMIFNTPIILYGVYVLISFGTLSFTTDHFRGMQWCSTMLGNLLFLFFVVNAIRSPKQVRLPIVLWLFTTLAIGGYAIYEFHTGRGVVQDDRFENSGYRTTDDRFSTVMIDYAEFDTIGAVKRTMGATSHPAVYGINVIMTLPFYFYLLRTSRSKWMRIFCVLGLAVGCYNVLLTNTRAAVIALAFTLLCIFFSRLVKHRFAIFFCLLAVTASAAPFLPQALYKRVFSVKNYSIGNAAAMRSRFAYWQAGVDIFADHWLLGIGSGNQEELPKHLTNMYMPPNTSIHNEYFESLLETGVLGYPVIVGFMIVLFRRCRRVIAVFRAHGEESIELFGVATLIVFITVLFYGVQCDVFHFTLKGWWMVMGLVVGLSEMSIQQLSSSVVDKGDTSVLKPAEAI